MSSAYNNTVVPGKDGKLIKSSDQIPPGSNVAGDEYAKGQDRERVHEAAVLLTMRWYLSLSAHWRLRYGLRRKHAKWSKVGGYMFTHGEGEACASKLVQSECSVYVL